MLRIGLVSAATYGYMGAPRRPGSNHGTAFATTFNGYDDAKSRRYEWTFVRSQRRLEGARILRVWDPHREWAERLADVCDISIVCESPEECAEDVDAVIVVDDGSGEHGQFAVTPLLKGVPTFCDKPLAMTARQAKALAEVARRAGTPLMSASSLRFVPDIVQLREEIPALGDVRLATVACAGELIYYGIHALEMAYAVLGRGAASCLNAGQPGLNVVRVRFENHGDVVLLVGEREWMQGGFQINLYGRQGWRSVRPDLSDLYSYLLERFLDYVQTGQEVVPIEEEVEVVAALEAAKRSLTEKREIALTEVLSGANG